MADEIDPETNPLGAARELPVIPDAETNPLGAAKYLPAGKLIPSETPGAPGLSVEHHLDLRLKQERTWKTVEPELKAAGVDPEEHRQQYQLDEARAVQKGEDAGGTLQIFGREFAPFASSFVRNKLATRYTDALERFKQGKATEEDAGTVARYERLNGLKSDLSKTFAGQAVQTLGKLGEMGGEAAALGPIASKVPGGYLARQAVITPAMPSLYQERAAQKNIAEGRSADDIKGFPTAVGLAYAQNLVLGKLGTAGQGAPGGIVGRSVAAGGIGTAANQGIDVAGGIADNFLPKAYATDTKYGTIGKLIGVGGEKSDVPGALKDATLSVLGFALFAGLHDQGPKPGQQPGLVPVPPSEANARASDPVVAAFGDALGHMKAQGYNAKKAGETLLDIRNKIGKLLDDNPNAGPAEARELFKDMPDGPIRKFAETLADALPTTTTGRIPVRGELPAGTPEGKPELKVTGEKPVPDTLSVEPNNPLDELHPDEVKKLAAGIGLTVKGLQAKAGEPWVRSLVDAAKGKSPPTQSPVEPEIVDPGARQEAKTAPAALGEPSKLVHASGEAVTRYPILKNGKEAGEARVIERNDGKTLHLEWIGERGKAAGEKGTFLGAEMPAIVRQIVAAHPNALFLTGLPVGGKRPSERRVIAIPGRTDTVSVPSKMTNMERMKARGRQPTAPNESVMRPGGKGVVNDVKKMQAQAGRELLQRAAEQRRAQQEGRPMPESPAGQPAPREKSAGLQDQGRGAMLERGFGMRMDRAKGHVDRAIAEPTPENIGKAHDAIQSLRNSAKARGINPDVVIDKAFPRWAAIEAEAAHKERRPIKDMDEFLKVQRQIAREERELHRAVREHHADAARRGQEPASVRREVESALRESLKTANAEAPREGVPAAAEPPANQGPAEGNGGPAPEPAVRPPTAARGGKSGGDKLSPLEKRLHSHLEGGTEFQKAEAQARLAGSQTMAQEVIDRGGINPNSFSPMEKQMLAEHFGVKKWQDVPIFRNAQGLIGGRQHQQHIDTLAAEMQEAGLIPRDASKHAPEQLMDMIINHSPVEAGEHGDRMLEEHWAKEIENAKEQLRGELRDQRIPDAEIERRVEELVRGGQAAAENEVAANPEAEKGGSGGEPEFDFGDNVRTFGRGPTGRPGAITIPQLPEGVIKAKEAFVGAWKKLGGQMFPEMVKAHPDIANAAARVVAAPTFSHTAWDVIQRFVYDNFPKDMQPKLFVAFHQARMQYMGSNFIAYGPDSPIKTAAEYQAIIRTPEFRNYLKLHQQVYGPMSDEHFRQAEGLAPGAPIPSSTQLPGYVLNMRGIREGDTVPEGAIFNGGLKSQNAPGAVGIGTKQGKLHNIKQGKLKFAKRATGESEGYDMDPKSATTSAIAEGAIKGAKAELNRVMVERGEAMWGEAGQGSPLLANGKETTEFRDIDPPKGTQATTLKRPALYVSKDIAKEFRDVHDVEEKYRITGITPTFETMTKLAMLAPATEVTFHTASLLSMAAHEKVFVHTMKNVFEAIWNRGLSDRQLVSKMELAKIGGTKPAGFQAKTSWSELFPNSKFGKIADKIDPTTLLSKLASHLLDMVDTMVRLGAKDAFESLQKAGVYPHGPQSLRDFTNLAGLYHHQAQAKIVRMLRESGAGPFSVAGFNNVVQSIRRMLANTGVPTATWLANFRTKGHLFGKMAAAAAAAAIWNIIRWGRWDGDDSTPLFAMKVGESNGRTQYMDPGRFIGPKRGLEMTGLMDLGEGVRKDRPLAVSLNKSMHSIMHNTLHPTMGPGVEFGHTMLTGEGGMGQNVTGRAEEGYPPAYERFKAAVKNTNSVFANFLGADRVGKNEAMPFWSLHLPEGEEEGDNKLMERGMRLFDPYLRSRKSMSFDEQNKLDLKQFREEGGAKEPEKSPAEKRRDRRLGKVN